MDYRIVLSPSVGLSAAGLADAWNESPRCRAQGDAWVEQTPAVQFDPQLAAVAATVISGIALGVAGNAVYDLIKLALLGRGMHKTTEMVEITQPDGTRIVYVKTIEE